MYSLVESGEREGTERAVQVLYRNTISCVTLIIYDSIQNITDRAVYTAQSLNFDFCGIYGECEICYREDFIRPQCMSTMHEHSARVAFGDIVTLAS